MLTALQNKRINSVANDLQQQQIFEKIEKAEDLITRIRGGTSNKKWKKHENMNYKDYVKISGGLQED